MTPILMHFLAMGGYSVYVFSAYACVFGFLFMQWFLPWRRLQHYYRSQKKS
jgi:heme exporter protein CcmD